jgi:hypothetical protein
MARTSLELRTTGSRWGPLGTDEVVEPGELDAENLPVEESEGDLEVLAQIVEGEQRADDLGEPVVEQLQTLELAHSLDVGEARPG